MEDKESLGVGRILELRKLWKVSCIVSQDQARELAGPPRERSEDPTSVVPTGWS